LRDTVAAGIPNVVGSILVYVDELMPGNYELEIQYGWLKDDGAIKPGAVLEIADFQIEIYSLHQDKASSESSHLKDRQIRELETIVRDLSVVSFIGKNYGQYLGEDLEVPNHPSIQGTPVTIPFKVMPEYGQVLLNTNSRFKYLDSIEVQNKASKAMIKRVHGDTENYISEILQRGEYLLVFNYKTEQEAEANKNSKPDLITFGISDYENIKKYKQCNSMFIEKCKNVPLSETAVMMNSNNGLVGIDFQSDYEEMLNIQLHYSRFLTQTPIKIFLDKKKIPISNENMKHLVLPTGNHTLVLKGPQQSIDETCILVSLIEYKTAVNKNSISQMPGIEMKKGIQSVVISGIQKGTTNLPLPNFKDNQNDTAFLSTLVLDFDSMNQRIKTPNFVELDMNFDSPKQIDYQPQFYYESSRDRIISYFDIGGKAGSDVDKQFEVIHNRDFKSGQYLAHLVILNGDQISGKFDS
jgi:hypothetical protein